MLIHGKAFKSGNLHLQIDGVGNKIVKGSVHTPLSFDFSCSNPVLSMMLNDMETRIMCLKSYNPLYKVADFQMQSEDGRHLGYVGVNVTSNFDSLTQWYAKTLFSRIVQHGSIREVGIRPLTLDTYTIRSNDSIIKSGSDVIGTLYGVRTYPPFSPSSSIAVVYVNLSGATTVKFLSIHYRMLDEYIENEIKPNTATYSEVVKAQPYHNFLKEINM